RIRSSGPQIRGPLSASIEDLELMFDKERLGDNGTETAGPRKPNEDNDRVDEKDKHFAHSAHEYQRPAKSLFLLQIRHSPLTGLADRLYSLSSVKLKEVSVVHVDSNFTRLGYAGVAGECATSAARGSRGRTAAQPTAA